MKKINKGDRLIMHSYKHDGKIHRSWDEAVLLDENEDYLVFGNERTLVVESDGRTWRTKEPAILYFYKNSWFNVIGQLKSNGIYYYCNIASPFIIEDDAIKFIDYDLDLRVFPDGSFKILDRSEYKYHKRKMNYSSDLDKIIRSELDNLIEMARNKKGPFVHEEIMKYHEEYDKLTKKA